jgi:hypothetical protein
LPRFRTPIGFKPDPFSPSRIPFVFDDRNHCRAPRRLLARVMPEEGCSIVRGDLAEAG